MTRISLLGVLALFALGACAAPKATKYSHVPETQVVVKGGKKKAAQANYQVSPEESRVGSGGSEK